ncbi:phage tail tape measure C-terminal domain-containing protein [Mesoterricola silvestris]|nr:phage tail tape measure C-terminal domain-containing protein [Mesoterricola silvestris]
MKILITGDASSAMGVLSSLGRAVKSTADQVEGHFNGMTGALDGMLAPIVKVAALLGGGAMFKGAVSDTVAFSKEVGGLQRLMGGTSQQATILSIAIGDIFGTTDDFEAAAQKMVRTLNKNEVAITRMGIQTRDSAGRFRDMNELLPEVVRGLSQYTAGADRDAAAQVIFGRGFKEVLRFAALTPEVMEAARKKTEDLGLVLDDQAKGTIKKYRDMLNDTDDAFTALKVRVGLEVMPALTDLGNWFASVAPQGINTVVGGMRTLHDLLGMTSVKLGILVGVMPTIAGLVLKIPALTMVVQSFQLQMALAAREGVTGFGAIAGAARGTGSVILGMISPWTLAAGAIIGGAFALEYFSKAHERAMRKITDANSAATKSAEDWVSSSRRVVELERELATSKGSEAHARAQERLDIAVKSLLAKYPTLAESLVKEGNNHRTISEAIEIENQKKLENLRLNLALAETAERDLQAGMATRKQWNDSVAGQTEAFNTGEGYEIQVQAHQAEIDFNNKQIAGAEKALQLQREKTKGLRDTLTVLTSVNEETKKGKGFEGTDSESALQKLKAALEERKYLYEKDAASHGQLLEFTKTQEVAWLKDNISRYSLNAKERAQASKMLFEAERAVLRETQDAKIAEMKASMEAFKHDKAEQLRIAVEMEKAAANPKEAQAARAEQARIRAEIKDQNTKILETEMEAERAHKVALLDLDAQFLEAQKSAGIISDMEALTRLEAINQKKYEIERKGLEDRLALANLEPTERAKINAQIQALDDKRSLGAAQFGTQKRQEDLKGNGQAGALSGISEYLRSSQDSFSQWKGMALQTLSGVENAFASGFKGILTGQMTFADGMRSIWSGITDTVIGSLAQMAARWVTAAIASAIFGDSVAKTAKTEAVAQQASAAAGIFAAHSWIPFVGPAIAAGLVAFMNVTLAANIASAKGMTAFALGGIVDGPTVGLLGEAGQRELVVPEVTFTNWAENLVSNITAHDQKLRGYQDQASSYSVSASRQTGLGMRPVTMVNDFRGAQILDPSQRGLRKLGSAVFDAARAKAREVGVVLVPGQLLEGV